VTEKLHLLIDVLRKQNDFNDICGNTSPFGAKIDKFTITKSGQNYLSFLKRYQLNPSVKPQLPQSDESCSQSKRKLHQTKSTDTKATDAATSSISPTYKRNTNDTVRFKITPDTDSTAPTCCNTSTNDPSTNPDIEHTNSSTPKLHVSRCNVNAQPPSYSTIVSSKSTPTTKNSTIKTIPVNKEANTIVPVRPKTVVPYVQIPPTEVTSISTMTSVNDQYLQRHDESNLITRLSDKQVNDITTALSAKYDSMIQQLQESYNAQMKKLVLTQNTHEKEINEIKATHKELKEEVDKNVNKKFDKHTEMFSSLVNMIKGITQADNNYRSTSQISSTKKIPSDPITVTNNSVSSSNSDLSYSEEESDKENDNIERATVSTFPDEIGEKFVQSPPTDVPKGNTDLDTIEPPPCVHENQIESDEKMILEK
jgi:hypothetical protein